MATEGMATPGAGNTSPAPFSPKARDWLLTLNQPEKYDELKGYITKLKSNNYLISAKEEAPTTGHEHIHIYCQFSSPIKLSIKKCCGAHIDKCDGTPQQVKDYVKKDGEIIDEIGVMRPWGGIPSIAEVKTATPEELETLPIMYYKTVEAIKKTLPKKRYYKPVKVHWYYGPTGTGKTRWAFEAGAVNVIYNNGFYSDWGDARIISIEEMRGQIPWDELLRLTDSYHNYYHVNIKGGQKLIDIDEIYISGPKPPEKCYPGKTAEDSMSQLLRRITDLKEFTDAD